jgi:hypothetical protein
LPRKDAKTGTLEIGRIRSVATDQTGVGGNSMQ